jgi:hypothetical protein
MAITQDPNALPARNPFELAKTNDLTTQDSGSLWHREPTIDGNRWNKLFPYQLIVVEQGPSGNYAPKVGKGWTFTLPIPPESISMTPMFAVQTSLTMGGVIEEHSGLRAMNISLAGTTGVFFGRDPSAPVKAISFLQSVFAGTIARADDTRSFSRDNQLRQRTFVPG